MLNFEGGSQKDLTNLVMGFFEKNSDWSATHVGVRALGYPGAGSPEVLLKFLCFCVIVTKKYACGRKNKKNTSIFAESINQSANQPEKLR